MRECQNPAHYFNRKGFWAVCVQAVCDADRKILYWSSAHPGSTTDSIAWRSTALGAAFEADELPAPCFLVGDAAYGLSNSLLTPWGDAQDPAKDSFDFWQSHLRINIECAFGILVARWGIFGRALDVPLHKVSYVIEAAFKLHNFCIDERELEFTAACEAEDGEAAAPSLAEAVLQSDGCDDEAAAAAHAAARSRERSARRAFLTERLRESGVVRPSYSGLRRKQTAA